MSTNYDLKLYYTFGRETLNFSKNNYKIINTIDMKPSGILSNPLCISSKYSFLGDLCFLCMSNENQCGTFSLQPLSFINGLSLFFWLNIININDKTNMNIVTIFINPTYSYTIYHNNNDIFVKINYNNNILNNKIGEININKNYFIYFTLNSQTGRVSIGLNNNDPFISDNISFNQPTNIINYNSIIFGDINNKNCACMAINEIKVYDKNHDLKLISDIYNNGNGVKSTLMLNLSISLSKTINEISQTDKVDIIFNELIPRLPLNYEINLVYYSNKLPTPIKYNYLKDSINSTSIGNNNIYSNDMFSKIIYIPADQNIININTNVNGIRIIDVVDLDPINSANLDLGNDAVINNYNLIELSDNSLYSSLISTNMENTPPFINNFISGNKAPSILFNGNITQKVYYIYIYKFSNNPNIYYYLDYQIFNKINNFPLSNLNLLNSGE